MNTAAHIERADRLSASLARCETGDYEAIIEGAMLAATDWLNAALHAAGLTTTEQDALHTEFLTLGDRRKIGLALPSLIEALDEIEEMRAPYVRGAAPGGEEAGRRALALLEQVRERARAAMSQG